MNKISLVYYSATGNTESMAKAIEEGIVEAGGKVTVYKSNAMNKDDILSSDVIVMGSSATGSEVIDESDLLPFMEEDADNWKTQLEGFGAKIVAMPILANEAPTDEELAQLKEIGKKLVTI